MSRVEELIEKLCPDGVEWLEIKILSKNITSGGTPQSGNSDYYIDGTIPWLRTQEVNFGDITNTHIKITQKGLDDSSAKWIPANCVIVAMYGATVGKIAINKIPLTTNQACCNIEFDNEKVYYKYAFYFLCSQYQYIKSLGKGSQTNINSQLIKNLKIPIPPLPIQEEIVRILDTFTELTNELQKELALRKKQYEYYRDTLLTFGEEVEWKILGNTCKLKSGKAIKATQILNCQNDQNKYQCFGGNGIRGYVEKFSHTGEFPIIGRQGALCGNINYATGEFYATEHAVVVESLGSYTQKFLFYLLTSMDLNQYKSKGAQPGLAVGNIENLIAPLPSLTEQQRIVDILDRFDTLTNDLTQGLPAEIEMRQKQYEYYRDKLLTFKQKENDISK